LHQIQKYKMFTIQLHHHHHFIVLKRCVNGMHVNHHIKTRLSTSNGFIKLYSNIIILKKKQNKKNEYIKNCNSKSGRLNEDSIQILKMLVSPLITE
jgi:hypothetical protein